jgi:hypothetical protein
LPVMLRHLGIATGRLARAQLVTAPAVGHATSDIASAEVRRRLS